MDPLVRTFLPLPGRREGKVRDIYDLPPARPGGPPRILIVATDRLSAFDVVLPTPIPGKGRILTELSSHWFRFIESRGLAATFLQSVDPDDAPGLTADDRAAVQGRIAIGLRCRVIPIECVARGYLAGSGWAEYQEHGAICGVPVAKGLRRGDRLPAPIFTPATKASHGHDENISFDRACSIAGGDIMERLRDMTLRIYAAAAEHALARGVIIADTKFEFGFPIGAAAEAPILIDEALTPDSSRFWAAEHWRPGEDQPSLDKQFVREHLLRLIASGRWDKSPPGPPLPDEVVKSTLSRYEEARRRLLE